jgi:hypothetical protein
VEGCYARVVELQIQPDTGDARIVEATPETIETALRGMGALQFIICTDESGRFMQDNGKVLEYGEHREGVDRLYRATIGSVRLRGSLPAFLSFLEGTDEWRELYRWDDVTDQVPSGWTGWLGTAAVIVFFLAAVVFVLKGIGVL